MKISFDPDKNARNVEARGISFDCALAFEWASAFLVEDVRRDYGEQRFQAIGYIDVRLHVLVFTPRGRTLHVISLRKANSREVKRYEAEIER